MSPYLDNQVRNTPLIVAISKFAAVAHTAFFKYHNLHHRSHPCPKFWLALHLACVADLDSWQASPKRNFVQRVGCYSDGGCLDILVAALHGEAAHIAGILVLVLAVMRMADTAMVEVLDMVIAEVGEIVANGSVPVEEEHWSIATVLVAVLVAEEDDIAVEEDMGCMGLEEVLRWPAQLEGLQLWQRNHGSRSKHPWIPAVTVGFDVADTS
jgi:hypothetical protein